VLLEKNNAVGNGGVAKYQNIDTDEMLGCTNLLAEESISIHHRLEDGAVHALSTSKKGTDTEQLVANRSFTASIEGTFSCHHGNEFDMIRCDHVDGGRSGGGGWWWL
jgi:hypothetical protein